MPLINSRKTSVTDDYTIEERAVIRNKVAEARHKTETEGEEKYIWKVRGTRKMSFILSGSQRPNR